MGVYVPLATSIISPGDDDVTATLTANGSAAASNADYFNDTVSGGLLNEHQSFGSMYGKTQSCCMVKHKVV